MAIGRAKADRFAWDVDDVSADTPIR